MYYKLTFPFDPDWKSVYTQAYTMLLLIATKQANVFFNTLCFLVLLQDAY